MTKREMKLYAAGKGVSQRKIAYLFGKSESYFCRMMSDEYQMNEEEIKRYFEIVDSIAEGQERGGVMHDIR